MKSLSKLFFLIYCFSVLLTAKAQQKPALVSPSVNSDQTVTFRLKTDSVWSFTTSVLPGDFYRYKFYVDGVETLDPLNSYAERAGQRYESILIIPDGVGKLYQVQDVPHGSLSTVWYPSSTIGYQRRMNMHVLPADQLHLF